MSLVNQTIVEEVLQDLGTLDFGKGVTADANVAPWRTRGCCSWRWATPGGSCRSRWRTVLLSTYVVRVPAMWRQAPITAAIVIAGGLQHHQTLDAVEQGVRRVAEVLFGCVVGIAVAWLLSKVWPLPEAGRPKASGGGGTG